MHRFLQNSFLVLMLMLLPLHAMAAAQLGQPLIPFKGIDLNGQPYDLQDAIGNRPMVLVFWASWCPTCRAEVPRVNQLAEKYRARGMEFVAVNIGHNDSVARAEAFVRKTGMTYPTYFDGSGTLAEKYQVMGVPTIIVADKHGIIRFRNFTAPNISEATFATLMAE
ncbi:MAG: TlpA family protein disulfide reductase [Proteobacteria bacterium]|nr:TlpA family protein disulfide reductase [Pseudomonadota bacterium]